MLKSWYTDTIRSCLSLARVCKLDTHLPYEYFGSVYVQGHHTHTVDSFYYWRWDGFVQYHDRITYDELALVTCQQQGFGDPGQHGMGVGAYTRLQCPPRACAMILYTVTPSYPRRAHPETGANVQTMVPTLEHARRVCSSLISIIVLCRRTR